jgi:transposase
MTFVVQLIGSTSQALRDRGDITVWFTPEAIEKWRPEKTGKRGRPLEYSEHAIATALLIRKVFHLPLRQTEGFLKSIVSLMDVEIGVPDFSSISKRSGPLKRLKLNKEMKPGIHVIVDSTGLKVYGKDEWHQEKHKVKAKRTWRKLHLAVDEKHQIIAVELTTPEVGDPTAVSDLLNQIDTDFDTFIADGAYDGEPIYQSVLEKEPEAHVVVPPHKDAVLSKQGNSQRDGHIRALEAHGRMNWQRRTGYNQRNYAELAMQRFKGIFGNTLKARALPQQKTEAWIATQALNRMTLLGMPISVKTS